jgi:cobalt-zinc-cadmium efflux system membrane fusion protein
MNWGRLTGGFACLGLLLSLFFAWPGPVLASSDAEAEAETPKGPHGGRLLEKGGLALELAIVTGGVPPEFRAWTTLNGAPVPPSEVSLSVETTRLGGVVETLEFAPEMDYLHSTVPVPEPHSYEVSVALQARGQSAQWRYASYEGRTMIPERIAREAGLEVEAAGPRVIRKSVMLTGTVQANPARLANVRPRFAGVITQINVDVDQLVRRGQQLAMLETNESLRSVPITAPIGGLVVNRDVQIGQVTGNQALFTIADLSEVWVILDVFGRKLSQVGEGMLVEVSTLEGDRFEAPIDHVSPLMSHGSQSAHARLTVGNSEGRLRAGQFVEGRVILEEAEVPLAVRRDALQSFRDFDAVFVRVGETYEVRMLELGRHDDEYVEVLSGLRAGDEYVTRNSYLVKADIEKSGASHDH